jgi:hypothetical protein
MCAGLQMVPNCLRRHIRIHITWECLMQGEDRDSSDEEWAHAYANMDPVSQLGWRNRRGAGEGPAEQLMRDVFAAADEVHSNAMTEMVGGRDTDAAPHNGNDRTPDVGSMSPSIAECRGPASSVEVDQEGGEIFCFCSFCTIWSKWILWEGDMKCGCIEFHGRPHDVRGAETCSCLLIWTLVGFGTRQRGGKHNVIWVIQRE